MACNIYNPLIQYGYRFKSLEFSGLFNVHYRLTTNMHTYASVIAGLRMNQSTGDKFVADIYKLTNADQASRLKQYNVAWDLGARWNIKSALFFDLGYTNGMINLLKSDNDEVPILREFYPYMRTTIVF